MLRSVARRGRRIVPLARQTARGESIPAPTGGWNARDSLADMDEKDAVILDNWFPRASDVKVRRGHSSHATGLGAAVESLMTWNGPSSNKMFAAASANIYDVTSSGAVGAAAVSSMTNARWQHTNFGNSAGAFLYLTNGADAPRYYDGSSWTVPTITGSGLTASNLISVAVFKRRLLFAEVNKLGFWYFDDVENVAGAVSYFDLGPVSKLGGYLMAIGSWTRDGGDGMDDLAVFVTSRGEAIVYQGTDPGDTSAWSHVGTFAIGPPVGRRCLAQLGADLVVITHDGFAPLSLFLATGRLSAKAAVSDKIRDAVTNAITDHRTKFGWQPIVYPRGGYVLFNIPVQEGSIAHQYVSNTTTGAWCRFTGQNANCWGLLDDNLYFGGSSEVFKADDGLDDDGADINTDAQTAFSYLGSRGLLKQFSMARPLLASDGDVYVAMEALVDYEERIPTATPTFTAPGGAEWDTATWDVDDWGDRERLIKNWQTITGSGYSVALRMRTNSNAGGIRWFSNDILWKPGALLG